MDVNQSAAVRKTIAVIDWGDTLHGLMTLEGERTLHEVPVVRSYLGYCVAKERRQYRQAIALCESAIKAEPHNAAHYLNLGRTYLLTRQKAKALEAFRKGLSKDAAAGGFEAAKSAELQAKQQALILAELRRMGIRKRAPFPSLPRSHPVNRVTGKLLARLGLR